MSRLFQVAWAQRALANTAAFFFLFRFITWAVAIVMLATGSAPNINRQYGEGLALYTLLHLVIGFYYAAVIHPKIAGRGRDDGQTYPSWDLLVLGLSDIVASLIVVYYSGGWGSPFWHFAVTALLVPCFLVRFRWAVAITTFYTGLWTITVLTGGDALDGTWIDSQLSLFIGFVFTAYLIGIAVSYLGHTTRALDIEKVRTSLALDDLQTLFAVARSVISTSADLGALLQDVTHTLRDRAQFDSVAIYLVDEDDNDTEKLSLRSSTVGIEDLTDGASVSLGQGVVGAAASDRKTLARLEAPSEYRIAVPLGNANEVFGVLAASVSMPGQDASRGVTLAEAIANQVTIGIQNSRLHETQLELAAEEERNRIARDIHDGVAQSMYALTLSLETCADLADREKGPLRDQIRGLVPLAKNTLLETRHYIYDLKPLLSGEANLTTVAENQVREFQMVSGTPTKLSIEGKPSTISVATATGLYRILQESLANVLKHAHASNVSVKLAYNNKSVGLTISDDGIGFDEVSVREGHGMGNMRSRVDELQGDISLQSSPQQGTKVEVNLPLNGGKA